MAIEKTNPDKYKILDDGTFIKSIFSISHNGYINYYYNEIFEPIKIEYPGGAQYEYYYNENNDMVSKVFTNSKGGTNTDFLSYDKNNNLIQIVNSKGRWTIHKYDVDDNRIYTELSNGVWYRRKMINGVLVTYAKGEYTIKQHYPHVRLIK